MRLVGRILGLVLVVAVAAALFYASRFWDFRLWERPGLFGSEALPPEGRLLGRWLRGTPFGVYELLIWAVAAFLILTALERLFAFVARLFR